MILPAVDDSPDLLDDGERLSIDELRALVTGRTDDLMIVRGVNVFPTQIEEIVAGLPPSVPRLNQRRLRPGLRDVWTHLPPLVEPYG